VANSKATQARDFGVGLAKAQSQYSVLALGRGVVLFVLLLPSTLPGFLSSLELRIAWRFPCGGGPPSLQSTFGRRLDRAHDQEALPS
jgi:hypothetical protein